MRLRAALLIAALLLPTAALSNGAMGYALEIYEFNVWTVYVVATIVLEGWIIGRRLGYSWLKSLALSLLFNFLTATCLAGGFFAPFLHWEGIDGNPLLWTVELLIGFGLVSAYIESIFWRLTTKSSPEKRILRSTLIAHGLGVPLAMVILLIPSRPYPGFEALTDGQRNVASTFAFKHVFEDRMNADGSIQQFRSFDELEKRLDQLGGYGVCLYNATYYRFSTRDARVNKLQVEFNPSPDKSKVDWLLRVHRPNRTIELDSDFHMKSLP